MVREHVDGTGDGALVGMGENRGTGILGSRGGGGGVAVSSWRTAKGLDPGKDPWEEVFTEC